MVMLSVYRKERHQYDLTGEGKQLHHCHMTVGRLKVICIDWGSLVLGLGFRAWFRSTNFIPSRTKKTCN